METATEGTKKPKAEVTTVLLSDGRSVDFAGKRKMLKETIIDGSTVSVRLDFRNGETRTWTIPDNLLLKTAGHGGEQKLGDETAGEEDVDDMVLSVDKLIGRLNKGEWTTVREPGSSMAGTSVLMQALIEASGKTKEEVKAYLENKSQAEKAALRGSSKLLPIIQRIEAEKAAKNAKVDVSAQLAELGIA